MQNIDNIIVLQKGIEKQILKEKIKKTTLRKATRKR